MLYTDRDITVRSLQKVVKSDRNDLRFLPVTAVNHLQCTSDSIRCQCVLSPGEGGTILY